MRFKRFLERFFSDPYNFILAIFLISLLIFTTILTFGVTDYSKNMYEYAESVVESAVESAVSIAEGFDRSWLTEGKFTHKKDEIEKQIITPVKEKIEQKNKTDCYTDCKLLDWDFDIEKQANDVLVFQVCMRLEYKTIGKTSWFSHRRNPSYHYYNNKFTAERTVKVVGNNIFVASQE